MGGKLTTRVICSRCVPSSCSVRCWLSGMEVSWLQGCPPGTLECTNGKPGMCAESTDACNLKVGCVAPLVACGFERDASSGRPLFGDDGKPTVLPFPTCLVATFPYMPCCHLFLHALLPFPASRVAYSLPLVLSQHKRSILQVK